MGKYFIVSYAIDIFPEEDVETPFEAARVAFDYMQDPTAMRPILRVQDVQAGISCNIDLEEEGLG